MVFCRDRNILSHSSLGISNESGNFQQPVAAPVDLTIMKAEITQNKKGFPQLVTLQQLYLAVGTWHRLLNRNPNNGILAIQHKHSRMRSGTSNLDRTSSCGGQQLHINGCSNSVLSNRKSTSAQLMFVHKSLTFNVSIIFDESEVQWIVTLDKNCVLLWRHYASIRGWLADLQVGHSWNWRKRMNLSFQIPLI